MLFRSQRRASVSNNQEISRGAFAMTRTCRYQAAVMRWVDMMYDPVMSAQNDWGPIGVTLAYNTDGLLEQIPAAEGESAGERRQKVAPGGPKAITAKDFIKSYAYRLNLRGVKFRFLQAYLFKFYTDKFAAHQTQRDRKSVV